MVRRSSGFRWLARVYLTVVYSGIFAFPLTSDEVYRRLWIFEGEVAPTREQIEANLLALKKISVLGQSGQLWFLQSQSKTIAHRSIHEQLSDRKITEAKPLVRLLRVLPWVVGVAVTGSVSVGNAKEFDDTDFMIITKRRRLWLTRVIVWLFAVLMHKRRSFAKEEPNSWCLNLWLTEESMMVPQVKQSLYTAYEVCQTKWLFDRDDCMAHFFQANYWVTGFLPRFHQFALQQAIESNVQQAPKTYAWLVKAVRFMSSIGLVLNLVDRGAEWFQRTYMKHHQTSEIVTSSLAYFHPRNRDSEYVQQLQQLALQTIDTAKNSSN